MSSDSSEEVRINLMGYKDEEAKAFSKMLATDTGGQLIDALVDSLMYKGSLTKKMPVTYSVTSYHLANAEKAKLVEKVMKKIHKKGIKHTHYKIPKQIVVIPIGFDKEELMKPGALKKLFKNGIKFASVAIVGFGSWLGVNVLQQNTRPPPDLYYSEPFTHLPIIVSIVTIGILLYYFYKKNRK